MSDIGDPPLSRLVVDPGTVSLVASLTLALAKAWREDDFELDGDEWAALRQFVSTAPRLIDMFGDQPDEELAARVTALSIRAFREALRRHWAGSELAVPQRVRFWQRWSAKHARHQEIEACIATALDFLAGSGSGGELARPLPELCVHQPELLPLYEALRFAFEEHGRDVDPPLLDLTESGRAAFDRLFRATWKEQLARGSGGELQRWLDAVALDRRRDTVRELLLGGLQAWVSGHVFAAAKEVPGLPWMPPEDCYVEPRAGGRGAAPALLLGAIEAALAEESVVVVTADFGYGKSLSARMLAASCAERHMNGGTGEPLPIYVPCGSIDWSGEALEIDELIRLAWVQQLEAIIGERLAFDDEGLVAPGPREPALIILDGLDEARLSSAEIDKLMARIHRAASTRGRRFVLFFRPGLLSAVRNRRRAIYLHIEPFDDDEIEQWVARWNFVGQGPSLTTAALAPVRELATVPILLFMIAYQWSLGQGKCVEDRHALYEGFAASLARGKLDLTREESPRIRATAEDMAERLAPRLARVRAGDAQSERYDNRVMALLWLMGRIAWMGYAAHDGPELGIAERDIDRLLREELDVDAEVEFHRVSLLTCIQGRLEGDAARRYLFFGHRSFHEFFVARFWRDTLLEVCAEGADEVAVVRGLLEGELIPYGRHGDQALSFLLEILDRLEVERRGVIATWAHRIAQGEAPEPGMTTHPCWHVLQLSALAISCHLTQQPELTSAELRAILAPMWASNRWRPLNAPGLRVLKADLSGAVLDGANLRGCDLQGANFRGTQLLYVDLCHAQLQGSWFTNTDTSENEAYEYGPGGDLLLDGANLSGASLMNIPVLALGTNEGIEAPKLRARHVTFWGRARGSFQYGLFDSSLFAYIDAESSDWQGAHFYRCVFVECDFVGANLEGCVFEECSFEATKWPWSFGGEWPEGLYEGRDLLEGRNDVPRPPQQSSSSRG